MSATGAQEIDRFHARSDDGEYETTIVVYRELIDMGTGAKPDAMIPGNKRARTLDGYPCSRINDDAFQIVDDPLHAGMIVRRVT
jgi:hypothetical protein